jgi:hypothetical protein
LHLLVSEHGLFQGSCSCTTDRSSPRPTAVNSPAMAARLSGEGTVSVLKVANDIDFRNAVNIAMAKSAGGELDGHDPDAAGRAAHQHGLAGNEMHMAQAEVGHRTGTPQCHRVGGASPSSRSRRFKRDLTIPAGEFSLDE